MATKARKVRVYPPKPAPVPLADETRSAITTTEAAFHLNRSEQTLRIWAMGKRDVPILPMRINGRLAWPVSELRRVLGVS